MSAWVSPVCGRAFTMLSIFTASTRFSEDTGSPVNGDSNGRAVGEGVADTGFACPPPRAASSTPVTRPAKTTTAATAMTALFRIQLIAPGRASTHLACYTQPCPPMPFCCAFKRNT